MKLKIALLLVSLPFLALGGEGLYHAARNRQQTTLTCDDLTRQIPKARWIRVTGCEIDYENAAWLDPRGQIREMYFPVRPAGRVKTGPVALVAATHDPEALAIAQLTIGDNRQPNQESFLVMMLRIVTQLKASREVEGYVRTGFLERFQTRNALSGLNTPLTDPYIALDLHARPSLLLPAIETAIGLAVLLGFVVLLVRRRTPEPAAIAEPDAAPELTNTAHEPTAAVLETPEPVSATPADAATSDSRELPDPWERAEFMETLTRVEVIQSSAPTEPVPSSTASETTAFLESLDTHEGIGAATPAEPDELGSSPELPAPTESAEPVSAAPEPVEAVPPPEPALPAEPATSAEPTEPLEPRYAAMLLLNLPGTAGPDALEHAPALGLWPDVVRRLSDACGGIGFDENGRGSFEGSGFSIALDVGTPSAETVWTATIRARGPAALEAAYRMAADIGWRIFVPKHGTFLVVGQDETVMKL